MKKLKLVAYLNERAIKFSKISKLSGLSLKTDFQTISEIYQTTGLQQGA